MQRKGTTVRGAFESPPPPPPPPQKKNFSEKDLAHVVVHVACDCKGEGEVHA